VFEDSTDFGEVPTTYEAEPWPALDGLSERHLALLRALWHCTEAGEAVAHARHASLAAMIGLKGEPKPGPKAQGSRQVRRLMNDLYDRGLVVPLDDKHAMVPGRDGGQRLGAKYYALKVPLLALPLVKLQVAPLGHGNSAGRAARTSAAPTRPSKPEEPERETAGRAARTSPAARTWPEADNPQVAPLGHEPPCPSSNVSTTCSPEESGEGAGVEEIPVVTLTPVSEPVEPPPPMPPLGSRGSSCVCPSATSSTTTRPRTRSGPRSPRRSARSRFSKFGRGRHTGRPGTARCAWTARLTTSTPHLRRWSVTPAPATPTVAFLAGLNGVDGTPGAPSAGPGRWRLDAPRNAGGEGAAPPSRGPAPCAPGRRRAHRGTRPRQRRRARDRLPPRRLVVLVPGAPLRAAL
jgi:hypothetical protein